MTESTSTAEFQPKISVHERVTKILAIIKEKLPSTIQEFLLNVDKLAQNNSVEPVLQSLAIAPDLNNDQLKQLQKNLEIISQGISTIRSQNFGPQSKLQEIDPKMAFVELSREIDSLNKDIQAKLIEDQLLTKSVPMEAASSSEDIAAD
jgi:hypothetical protein